MYLLGLPRHFEMSVVGSITQGFPLHTHESQNEHVFCFDKGGLMF